MYVTRILHLGFVKGQYLFCGIGNFSLPLVRAGAEVVGVEAAADAVEMARHNAQLNQLQSRVEFKVADLYNAEADHGQLLQGFDALLLDPPRSGAGEHLSTWIEGFSGSDIVYVSCNPESFAKDAGVLQGHGFQLNKAGIFDMFPHTAHVESIAVFQKS